LYLPHFWHYKSALPSIEKFLVLNDNLEQTVTLNSGFNSDKLLAIKEAVEKRGHVEREVRLVQKTEKLHQETSRLISYIDTLKKNLIGHSGGKDEEGNLIGAKEETEVEVYMLGSDLQKGNAYELKARLNDYVFYVNQQFAKSYPALAPDGIESNLYRKSEHKNKDFAQLNFGQTPVAAALAVLSEIETKIVAIENSTLVEIAGQVMDKDYHAGRTFSHRESGQICSSRCTLSSGSFFIGEVSRCKSFDEYSRGTYARRCRRCWALSAYSEWREL
jgi:gliding motility-associated protein GldM